MATSLKIDDELKGRIQRLAGLRQRSPHWSMREAIAQYVEHEEVRESRFYSKHLQAPEPDFFALKISLLSQRGHDRNFLGDGKK